MLNARTTTIYSGDDETVVLPKTIAYGEAGLDLTVTRSGDVITIRPAQPSVPDVDRFRAMLERLSELPPLDEESKFVRPPFEAPDRGNGW